jgi:UDP-N-acetylmuramate dehydrogenase
MVIKENYSIKHLNTFHIDAKAKIFVEIFSDKEIKEFISERMYSNYIKLILGGGSNVLFTKDFEGVIVKNSIPGINIIKENEDFILIEAGAGVIWDDLVRYCVENNWGGIENLSLIPGTVGAAPIQNIGAYGQELSETLVTLKGVSLADNVEKIFTSYECKFGYRDSIFKSELKNKFFISSINLRLNKNPRPNLNYTALKNEIDKLNIKDLTIKDAAEVVIKIRKSKLPDPQVTGNAGSFFKNPEVSVEKYKKLQNEFKDIPGFDSNGKIKIPAAWLIENCGWKGKRFGNVGVHEEQPLVLVNFGNAKGSEILDLSRNIKSSIWDRFGIMLSEEVNVI